MLVVQDDGFAAIFSMWPWRVPDVHQERAVAVNVNDLLSGSALSRRARRIAIALEPGRR